MQEIAGGAPWGAIYSFEAIFVLVTVSLGVTDSELKLADVACEI